MKMQPFRSDRSDWSRTPVFAMVGLAGALGIVILVTTLSEVVQNQDDATARGPRRRSYLQSGRWRADVRTAVAAVRYLLEPEPRNAPSGRCPSLELAMPTNSAVAVPKV